MNDVINLTDVKKDVKKREKMKNRVKITLVAALSLLLLTACSGENTQTAEGTSNSRSELILHSHTKTKKIHDAIMQAGEESGLKMTEFKPNAVIAERLDGSNSASATIVFNKDKITIMKESGNIGVDDLLEAIEHKLKDGESEH